MKKYDFKQSQFAITAFIGNLEKKIQEVKDEIPVYIMDTGDSSYFFNKKFEKFDTKEIYLKVPRVILKLEDLQPQTDQNSNQYVPLKYVFDDKLYEGQFRRVAINLPVSAKFVSSNFVMGLTYFELLVSIGSIDNVFTYEYLGNTYESSYNVMSYSFQEGAVDASSTSRNFVVTANFEVGIQLFLPRYSTLREIDGFISDSERNKIEFSIISKDRITNPDGSPGELRSETDLSGKNCSVCDDDNCEIHPNN